MRKSFLIFILFLLFPVLPLMAQQPLSLDSCLALAREHNCTIRVARLEVLKAHEVKRQMFTKYFPQVSGSFMAYHALNHLVGVTPADEYPAGKDFFDEWLADDEEVGIMLHGWSASATAVQPLFSGGRIVNANRYAKVGIEAAELQAEATERDVLEEVQSAYLLLRGLQEKVATVEAAMVLLDSLDRVVSVGLQSGVLESADALRLELKRNEMRAKQLQLQNGIRLAGKLLCHQIGISYPESGLQLAPVEDISGAAKAALRPEYRLLQLNLKSERYKKRLTLGEALPQVALGGTYFYGDLFTNGSAFDLIRGEDTYYRHNGLLFVTATVPLTGWWETAHKLRQHNYAIQQAELQQADLTGKLRLQEEQYESEMLEAEALMQSDSAALRLAEENYRLAELNYTHGMSTITDVLEANALLLEAQNALTDRRISYLAAKRKLMDVR